jgi:hypothetical protein
MPTSMMCGRCRLVVVVVVVASGSIHIIIHLQRSLLTDR